MIVFISGGSKSGKSSLAEDLAVKLAGDATRWYIATMVPHDEEDRQRIRKHIASRSGKGFITLESADADPSIAIGREKDTFLLDSVTALLSNRMFRNDYSVDPECGKKTTEALLQLAGRVNNIVFVSDYIYADAENYGELTEEYRRNLALIDQALANAAGLVIEMTGSFPIVHKGELL
ncbi:MAG: bifunctional adenosylcobinamide kinase/adenosylcobinamide-phosphate guanylyltransferase [Firmicutes bacterium]|nr:bifunctional adenosylcobinamide kinase/adenosylcobinamide-phosphate guanylyltransferase [Bacillota bacterium]